MPPHRVISTILGVLGFLVTSSTISEECPTREKALWFNSLIALADFNLLTSDEPARFVLTLNLFLSAFMVSKGVQWVVSLCHPIYISPLSQEFQESLRSSGIDSGNITSIIGEQFMTSTFNTKANVFVHSPVELTPCTSVFMSAGITFIVSLRNVLGDNYWHITNEVIHSLSPRRHYLQMPTIIDDNIIFCDTIKDVHQVILMEAKNLVTLWIVHKTMVPNGSLGSVGASFKVRDLDNSCCHVNRGYRLLCPKQSP